MTVADFPAMTQRRYNKVARRNWGGFFYFGRTATVAAAIPGCRIALLPAGWSDVEARS
jgi:hypothetical protein